MKVNVIVCVITFRRPHGLRRLLEAIDELAVDETRVDVSVVVVDNDPAGGARRVVCDHVEAARFPVRYAVEPRRGIPMARNRALRMALDGDPDFIAWLDDDEAPASDWLRCVMETQAVADADVVIGPRVMRYEDGTPAWFRESGLAEGARFSTGEMFPFFHARTCGVLIRRAVLPVEGFEERMALTGGSDLLYFTRIHRAGGRFCWDDRAVMYDHLPASRASVAWLLRRWYRIGVTRSLTLLYLDEPGLLRRARRVLGGLWMALRGLAGALLAAPRGRVAVLRRFRRVMVGIGSAAGAVGLRYHEYRGIHGS